MPCKPKKTGAEMHAYIYFGPSRLVYEEKLSRLQGHPTCRVKVELFEEINKKLAYPGLLKGVGLTLVPGSYKQGLICPIIGVGGCWSKITRGLR